MKFSNKALTLKKIKTKNSIIPKLLIIKTKNFYKNKKNTINNIKNFFSKNEILIVRSSSSEEDSSKKSNAGAFVTVPNVKNNYIEIHNAIKQVIKSYKNKNNSILFVQKMITDCNYSGVITTCNLNTKAPYYVVSYHDGKNTSVATSGKAKTKNYFQFKYFKGKGLKKFSKIINLAKELELKFKNNFLDIEFGVKKNKVYLFQVRPIVLKERVLTIKRKTFENGLEKLKNKILKLKKKNHNLLGKTTYFGVMPDWNPAEIIGIKPNNLSISLYQELITDFIWAKNRNTYGFEDMTSNHLMTIFLGTPYIDVRVDFNSWIPSSLDDKIKKKLISYYLRRFEKNSHFHDKIEFEILFTCYNASTKDKLKKISANYLSKYDKSKIIKELKKINDKALSKIDQEIKKIEILKKKQKEIGQSNLYSIDKIFWLIEDCKRYGTEPFAGLARSGFIAIEIINSLVNKEIISNTEKDNFMQSINTITKEILKNKKISKKNFCEKYGHLRPNTYDILSKNYEENYIEFFGKKNLRKIKYNNNKFNLSDNSKVKLKQFLKKNFSSYNISNFFNLLRKAIENREYSKFIFTKSIDMIFRELKYLSKRHNIKLQNFSNLNIKIIKELYYNLNNRNIKDILNENMIKNYEDSKLNRLIELPQVIVNPEDIYYFNQEMDTPNFFGSRKVVSEIVYLNNKTKDIKIDNKIVCISSADPGYDFIFNYNIVGLVTEYGGVNSHMSIRCAELNIPAAIGVGNIIFNKVINSKKIHLDPETKQIDYIE